MTLWLRNFRLLEAITKYKRPLSAGFSYELEWGRWMRHTES